MNWEIFSEASTWWLYLKGMEGTFYMLAGLLACGGILGLVFALMLCSRWAVLRGIASSFTYVVRGTPLLIQIFLIYYGIAQLDWVRNNWDSIWILAPLKSAMFCAMLAFSINHAGYLAEILAGAIRDTSKGEVEAGYAMGMSRLQVLRRIILPSAMRRALPPYTNEVMQMMHATSLASTIPAMLELTAAAQKINRDYYLTFEAYLFAAGLYLVLTFTMMGIFRLIEKRYTAYLQPRTH